MNFPTKNGVEVRGPYAPGPEPELRPLDFSLLPETWQAVMKRFGVTQFLAISRRQRSMCIGSVFLYSLKGGSWDNVQGSDAYYIHNGFLSVVNGRDMELIGAEYLKAYNLKYSTSFLPGF